MRDKSACHIAVITAGMTQEGQQDA